MQRLERTSLSESVNMNFFISMYYFTKELKNVRGIDYKYHQQYLSCCMVL